MKSIHRGTMVDLNRIEALYPRGNREYDVEMKNGSVLRLSRSFRNRLAEKLGL